LRLCLHVSGSSTDRGFQDKLRGVGDKKSQTQTLNSLLQLRVSNASREIDWLPPHPLARLLIFIQRTPSVYPVKEEEERRGGAGPGRLLAPLDPFSAATAGSSGGTKSPGASPPRPRTELPAGSGRRAVTFPAQSSIPTSSAAFHPSLSPPSFLPSLPPLPPPPAATIRTQSELGLAPAPTSPSVCPAVGRAAEEEERSGRSAPASAGAGGRAAPMPGGRPAARSPAPAREQPVGASPRRHRRPSGLKHSLRRAAEGEGEQVSAGCTCAPPCFPPPPSPPAQAEGDRSSCRKGLCAVLPPPTTPRAPKRLPLGSGAAALRGRRRGRGRSGKFRFPRCSGAAGKGPRRRPGERGWERPRGRRGSGAR